MIKVAIFGGSFDPPHKGHQSIVLKALEKLDINTLIILPAFLNPFKRSTLASPEQRLRWCHILFDEVPGVEVSNYETEKGRPVYTSDSLRYFQEIYEVRYLIIGADNLKSIDQWHKFNWINKTVTWVVAERDAHPPGEERLERWIPLKVDMPISSTEIREGKRLDMIDSRIREEVAALLKQKKENDLTIDKRIEKIIKLLDEKKAEEIEVFNLDDIDYIAKRVVIANSLGGKHTQALFDHLKEELKPTGEEFLGADESNDWVVADLGDIIIHIMTPEYRQKYSLEEFLGELQRPLSGSDKV